MKRSTFSYYISCLSLLISINLTAKTHAESSPQKINTKIQEIKDAWCEHLNDGYWTRVEGVTKEECNVKNKRNEGGPSYSWQTKLPDNSHEGKCINNGYSEYDTSQRGCENHDKNGFNGEYKWKNDKDVMLYASKDFTGYSTTLKESNPKLEGEHDRLRQHVGSYSVPEGLKLEFYTQENFKGGRFTRGSENFDNHDFPYGSEIKSIKIITESPFELISSAKQIYVGTSNPAERCGQDGRILTKKEIDKIGQTNICQQIPMGNYWAIWLIKGEDGSDWSFMGPGYQCQSKANISPEAHSLCVMKDIPKNGSAYLYPGNDFQGSEAWDGKAEVKTRGNEERYSNIKSFKLGKETTLIGYTENNFKGEIKTYSVSTNQVDVIIRSYKVL